MKTDRDAVKVGYQPREIDNSQQVEAAKRAGFSVDMSVGDHPSWKRG